MQATTIDEVLALPDSEIDIATAILLLSKQWGNTIDVEKYRKQIDEMAMSLEPSFCAHQNNSDLSSGCIEGDNNEVHIRSCAFA